MTSAAKGSFWLQDSAVAAAATRKTSAKLPESCNILVVGAGISGASTAHFLTKLGAKDVVVVDKGPFAHGATGRNGGQLLPMVFDFQDLVAKHGLEGAVQRARFERYNGDLVAAFLAEEQQQGTLPPGLSPELLMNRTIVATPNPIHLASLKENVVGFLPRGAQNPAQPGELAQLDNWLQGSSRAGGIVSGRVWSAAECQSQLGTSEFCGALEMHAGCLWPAKLTLAMLLAAERRGANLQSECGVVSITADPKTDHIFVKTTRGVIKCRNVVVCTNAWTGTLLPKLKPFVTPVRAQILLAEMAPHAKPALTHNLIVSRTWAGHHEPNHSSEYLIRRKDGLLVFGGQRDKDPILGKISLEPNTATDDLDGGGPDAAVEAALKEQLHRFFADGSSPPAVSMRQSWTGVMAFSPDDAPFVGRLPPQFLENLDKLRDAGAWISGVFTGHGMGLAIACGKAMAEMILGHSPAMYHPMFDPARLPTLAKL
eukprot:TRINITY_DN6014_c0_g1_i1.p1 TRINITY_DN6014_c0_g1~~TRINITY_DN6014_c0_g1_i1.p1  ORF type:complete len:484 (+),score=99.40 TRINITY_DN6014_c0_g1_i1:1-1452(+)